MDMLSHRSLSWRLMVTDVTILLFTRALYFQLVDMCCHDVLPLQVAVWHPTFYLPLDFRSTAKCADIPSDPMEQLQEVETEKRRLRAQGIHVADETEAFHFFTQHTAKARTEKIAERQQNSASYWDPEEQVLCGSDKERNLGCAPVQSLEQQLQRLALDVTSALPGTEQQQLSRSYHPDTALSTLLVELRPVEDIVMAEKLVDLQSTSSSSGNPTSSKPFEKKPTACVHFRYGSETVFRLLPLLSTPSSSLLESMQQCHQDVIDAVEAHRKVRWKAGDDVFCIASDRQQQLRPGLTGVLEKDPTSEDSHVLVRVSSWREEPIGFQADLDDACSAICAASSVRQLSLHDCQIILKGRCCRCVDVSRGTLHCHRGKLVWCCRKEPTPLKRQQS